MLTVSSSTLSDATLRREETRLVWRESDGQPASSDKPDGVLI
jgi:hypothetical protein